MAPLPSPPRTQQVSNNSVLRSLGKHVYNPAPIKLWLQRFRRNQPAQLIVVLSLLHLIPIWGFKFIPTQDGISHVYNAYILKEWKNPEFTKFHEVYDLNLTFFPNWIDYAILFVTLHVFPPLIAEKIFATICVLLYPFSFYYLLNAIDRQLRFFALLGFLYSYNHLFHLGFYNFAISVPFCLISIGYWWKHKEDFQIEQATVLNLLLIVTYFSHFSSYTLLMFALTFLAGVAFLRHLFQWREHLKRLLQFIGYLAPAYFILLNIFLSNPEQRQVGYRPFAYLWDYFINVKSLVYFNDSYLVISWILLGIMSFCLGWTLIVHIGEKRFFEVRDGFLLLAIILTVLYFRLPWSYGPPSAINERVHLYIFPILLGWFVMPKYVWLKRGLIGVMLLISVWHLGLTVLDYSLLDKEMREFTSGSHLIESNSTVSILRPGMDWVGITYQGPVRYVMPFLQMAAYYCLENGSLYDSNYEPKYSYFPLQYKGKHWMFKYEGGPIDYWIVWRAARASEDAKLLVRDYEVIHKTANLKLFRLRSKSITSDIEGEKLE